MKNSYILTAGYGWSGSSAIVDLLKEYKEIVDTDVEFRLIRDPNGLADLRSQLLNNWDILTVDSAVKNFLRLASSMNHVSTKTTYGLGYEKRIGSHFMLETENFIKNITSYSFRSNSWILNISKSKMKIVMEKIFKKMHMNYSEGFMYFSKCTENQFDNEVRKYLTSLFPIIQEKSIILDQAISPVHPDQVSYFFDNAKMIIVDRDPRDVYVNLIKGKNLIGAELSRSHDVNKYIEWHITYRQKRNELKKYNFIKQFQFEDLIFNYDKSVKEVEQFLGLSDKDHIAKRKYFDPDISIKNVGAWKNYPYQDEIRIIEKELPDYLYTK